MKQFKRTENTGTEISYRCIKCRSCNACKNNENLETVNVKEEIEQDLINNSVSVHTKNQMAIASLPFIHSPEERLAPNRHKAEKVYKQQLRKLANKPNDKEEVLKSEEKSQQLGYVDYVSNLPDEIQTILKESPIQSYIPWRAVWKENSLTTPCRLVFDASQPTDSRSSLNDILAKGRNSMNKLQEVFIWWTIHRSAFHVDISKMYNTIQLRREHWVFQRYLWENFLDPAKQCQEKVIKTIIYGVCSSGNQAERALRMTAEISRSRYPQIYEIISRDIYVVDCISGSNSENEMLNIAYKLEIVLNSGGFSLKGIASSSKDNPESLSDDGVSIHIAGRKWYTKDDLLPFDFTDMNFSKRVRGRKVRRKGIPAILTRRHCVSKVVEIYDLARKLTPLTASSKIDLHELVKRNLQWDDAIPDNLRAQWISNFDMMKEIKTLTFKRAIVPDDAANLDIQTIEFGDASKEMACAAVYARFQRKNG